MRPRLIPVLLLAAGLLGACGFDETLRAYLDAHFWLPFAKRSASFERPGVRRISAPFAGMVKAEGNSPLDQLRAAYQENEDPESAHPILAAARADRSLSAKDREEVELIDAKIDMRSGELSDSAALQNAKKKLEQFLKTARTPAFLSEARGWLAHVDYVLGDQTAAGKIYLDELNRNGSNLSRETLLTSLQMNYGYDGGPDLLQHLDEYFDTPEHAAFAIQMATNPHWPNYGEPSYESARYRNMRPLAPPDAAAKIYPHIQALLEQHRSLFAAQTGSGALALLSMRVALRMGDPPSAIKIAEMLPPDSPSRSEPDFLWILASSEFLSHDYSAAEKPLLDLFKSARASNAQKAAAAYGLVGVYRELNNPVEGIHYALAIPSPGPDDFVDLFADGNEDMSVYWAVSGWDQNLLLDSEAPIDALKDFLAKYPNAAAKQQRLVKYSLAVRLARESKYDEAAQIYQSINAPTRADRMRKLAPLYQESVRADLSPDQLQQAKFKFADFLAANEDRIYFNDQLWSGVQRYALYAENEDRLDRSQRDALIAGERQLKDGQEEYWRAYLILREVVKDSGKTTLGRQAARLAIRCLRRINTDRFGREEEIRAADIELSKWLREP